MVVCSDHWKHSGKIAVGVRVTELFATPMPKPLSKINTLIFIDFLSFKLTDWGGNRESGNTKAASLFRLPPNPWQHMIPAELAADNKPSQAVT